MKKLKMLFAGILVLIMALGVVACGGGGNAEFNGNYNAQASEEQVAGLSAKIEGKSQVSELLSYEMEMDQTLNYDGMKTVTSMKIVASGTSAADLKMSGTGTSKITMQGQTIKGTYKLYMTDGWMYIDMTMAGYTEKYKMQVYDPSQAGAAMGGSASAKDLDEIIASGGQIYIDEQADGTTKIKAVYEDNLMVEGSALGADMTMYFILDAEGNTTSVRMTCDVNISGIELKIDMTMKAKDVTVSVPGGLADDSSYELM